MRLYNETPYHVRNRVAMYQVKRPFMAVIIKGTFKLDRDAPATPLSPDKQAKISSATTYLDDIGTSDKTPTDVAPFKPRADCLFIGSAHAPDGNPVQVLEARFVVGPMSKTLSVYGDRQWVREADGTVQLTEPRPFNEVPMRAEYAHGGLDSTHNYHGLGFEPLGAEPGASVSVANIVPEGQTAISWEHDIPHAGFGMLAPMQQPRRALLGTTDKHWSLRRRPLPPKDFDPLFFNAAPLDQQIDGYLAGDEEIALLNLHPDESDFRAALPGRRVRCFVNRTMDSDDPSKHIFAEVKTVLDTCIVDVPAETLTLVWRGTLEIVGRHHDRIDHLLVVDEPVNEPATPESYAALLQEKLVDPRRAAAKEEAEARKREIAEIQEQGLKDAVATLKEGGAPAELIADVEAQDSLEGAQKAISDWVEKVSATLPK